MAGYLSWTVSKLASAPANSCAFWIDLDRVLTSGNHALSDVEIQAITDDRGRDWQVVRYRSNPFPARRQLAARERTVVWCTGMAGDERVDLTAFEDHLGRAWHVLDVSLTTLARERHPALELPPSLGREVAGIDFDPEAYVEALARQHSETAVTTSSATDILASMLIRQGHAVLATDAITLFATSAVALASAETANARNAVRLALRAAGDTSPRLRELAQVLVSSDSHDVISAAYVAAGFAHQRVPNLGSVMVAEGWCSGSLRDAVEAAGGRLGGLLERLTGSDLAELSRRFEATLDATMLARLRNALESGAASVDTVFSAPQPAMRMMGTAARFREFIQIDAKVSGPGLVTQNYKEELAALDIVGIGIRRSPISEPPPLADDCRGIAEAWARSAASTAHLKLARAEFAFREVEWLFAKNEAAAVRQKLAETKVDTRAVEDIWSADWRGALASDVDGFLSHPLQGWRLSQDFADRVGKKRTWLLVFDGLRYDLWKAILSPAVHAAGWNLPDNDVSFAYLPSVTEVGRRAVVGGSPRFAYRDEESAARALAERAGGNYSYSIRSEHFDKHREEVHAWNVRVFSWPDRFVHTDVADLGTLAAQFENWVQHEFVAWLQANVERDANVVITTDHGFAELAAGDGLEVEVLEGDRNSPRVVHARLDMGEFALVVPDHGGEATIATGRAWFQTRGGSPARFAHGGCSLHEVVVPFAKLIAAREGAAQFEISGLPDVIALEESAATVIRFVVTVNGGREMFPTVVVNGRGELLRRQVSRGEPASFEISLTGEEGLDRLVVRAQSGDQRREWIIPTHVKLARIKRAVLDFDD